MTGVKIKAAVYAAVLLTLPALAASPLAEDRLPAGSSSRNAHAATPLRPGRPASVRRAQAIRGGLALVGAGGVIATVAVVAATGGGNGGSGGQVNPQSVTVTTGTP